MLMTIYYLLILYLDLGSFSTQPEPCSHNMIKSDSTIIQLTTVGMTELQLVQEMFFADTYNGLFKCQHP